MINHLLIPLDGSSLAEIVLPYARTLYKALHPRVTLIHMIEQDTSGSIHGERHLATEEEACVYLGKVASEWFPADADITCHVHTEAVDSVAGSLADHIDELKPDLVLMCAHGSGGWRDFTVGNLAHQVISRTRIPIILIKKEPDPQGNLFSFLVCLDGLPEHEEMLPAVVELARVLGAEVRLLMVVHTTGSLPGSDGETGRLLPNTTRAVLDATEDFAYEYLGKKALVFEESERKVSIQVLRGDPAQEILEVANTGEFDLLAVGTHGKAGLGAFWAGSVGARVINGSSIPLLMVPARTNKTE
jgi:nucleotide-binding universal stress UspA family protein